MDPSGRIPTVMTEGAVVDMPIFHGDDGRSSIGQSESMLLLALSGVQLD